MIPCKSNQLPLFISQAEFKFSKWVKFEPTELNLQLYKINWDVRSQTSEDKKKKKLYQIFLRKRKQQDEMKQNWPRTASDDGCVATRIILLEFLGMEVTRSTNWTREMVELWNLSRWGSFPTSHGVPGVMCSSSLENVVELYTEPTVVDHAKKVLLQWDKDWRVLQGTELLKPISYKIPCPTQPSFMSAIWVLAHSRMSCTTCNLENLLLI